MAFTRGERQKETTDQYRENWDVIFSRKKCTNADRYQGGRPEAANEQDRDVCPDCGGHLRAKWSGVECGVCGYTFCY